MVDLHDSCSAVYRTPPLGAPDRRLSQPPVGLLSRDEPTSGVARSMCRASDGVRTGSVQSGQRCRSSDRCLDALAVSAPRTRRQLIDFGTGARSTIGIGRSPMMKIVRRLLVGSAAATTVLLAAAGRRGHMNA